VRVLLFVFATLTSSPVLADNTAQCQADVVSTCFSPKGGCRDMVINAIRNAKHSVYMEGYYITSKSIVNALVKAYQDNRLAVAVIADKSQKRIRNKLLDVMADAGMTVSIDNQHAIFHDKILIIDGEFVVEGSFNFTDSAESRNAENMLVLKSKCLVQRYMDNFHLHQDHADAYSGAATGKVE
jgi:phosphatidylserine/phosphatidylglycerophosphate/cardiolipin synthase-like enzyme